MCGLHTINYFDDYIFQYNKPINSFFEILCNEPYWIAFTYIFGIAHVKVGFIPRQKMYVMLKLKELVLNYTFVQ